MDMDIDVDAILPDEMKNIFDHSDFMTSEFFDSVMSMEKEDIYESRYDDLMSAIKSEDSSSTRSPIHDPILADPVTTEYLQSNQLFDNVTIYGKENDETIPSKEFLPLLKQNNIQNNINDILGLQNKSSPVIIRPKKIVVQSHSTPKKVTSVTKKPQVLRIQSISGNGRPLLLPVNVKNVKKYRVINASNLKVDSVKVLPAACQSPPKKLEYALSTSSESTDDIDVVGVETSYGDKYPPLQLTAEEKRLLMKDGITLPTHYPLSKHDEKELKRIRRKIRNKISAQDSRKRKKEYVDQLEEKARKTDEENEILKKKVKYLNKENTKLHEQLKKLQDILFSSSNKATPTTCLMIVLFSTLLVCLPNLRPANNKDLDVAQQELVAARRALLFNQNVKEEEDMSIDEFLVMKKEEAEAAIEEEEKENGTGAFIKYIGDLSKKYEALIRSNCTEILQGGSIQDFCKRHEEDFKTVLQSLRNYIDKDKEEKKFIEPDISDEEDIEDDDLMKKLSGLSNFNENRFKALEIEFASTLENNSLPVKQK